ncbi:MAG: hypothetical protein ACJAUH_001199 [Saprospiraceae bacterium]
MKTFERVPKRGGLNVKVTKPKKLIKSLSFPTCLGMTGFISFSACEKEY